jgi:NAD(P)-dependent dehydrogenase (short-subunit alcohol dehydrogenase family)
MEITGSVALVTGANRGIGRALTRALLGSGAAKVYAGARDPASVADADVTPLRLDVTKPDEIAGAAAAAGDVTIVINNAGAAGTGTPLLDGPFDSAREAMEVNYFGTWGVSRAFAPVLARNGGGALVNVLSLASWVGRPRVPRLRRLQGGGMVADELTARRPARLWDAGHRGARGLRGH